jgi:hypothetical protein
LIRIGNRQPILHLAGIGIEEQHLIARRVADQQAASVGAQSQMMRRTSFCVDMSITLIDAPAEFKTKTMPFAQAGDTQPMAAIARNNKKVRRRMANNAPADWRRSRTRKPRIE